MLSQMPSRLLTEWVAYDQIDPIGLERGDLQAGIIAAVVAEVNRDRKRRSRPFHPVDFMPFHEKGPGKEMTPDEILQKVVAINQALGGKDLRKKDG